MTATIVIIPSRYASSRYPGKPLAPVRGVSGACKPLIQRSIEAAQAVSGTTIYVATDDERIAAAATNAGTAVLMTPSDCANGTERVAASVTLLQDEPDFVVNFQGDALLTPAALVERLIAHMRCEPECEVATVAVRSSPAAYRQLLLDQAEGRSGGTTVVTDRQGRALYFSKRVLPYCGSATADASVLLHLGLYAYRPAALQRYTKAAIPAMETLEGLEQLRFLAEGVAITVIECDPPEWDVMELNNPSDLAPIEAILAARGIE